MDEVLYMFHIPEIWQTSYITSVIAILAASEFGPNRQPCTHVPRIIMESMNTFLGQSMTTADQVCCTDLRPWLAGKA